MNIKPDQDYYLEEMHRKNMIEEERRCKEQVKWEWRHIFDPTRHAETYPESVLDTYSLGRELEREGHEVVYVYSPTGWYWNDHGQQLYVAPKSRAVLSTDEVVSFFRSEMKDGDVIVLLAYVTGLRGIDGDTGDRVIFNKVRYDIVNKNEIVVSTRDIFTSKKVEP